MQPGEFVCTRTIKLCDSGVTCSWRLWDAQAEQFGDALLGRLQKVLRCEIWSKAIWKTMKNRS